MRTERDVERSKNEVKKIKRIEGRERGKVKGRSEKDEVRHEKKRMGEETKGGC
jgi:hypothetical protein